MSKVDAVYDGRQQLLLLSTLTEANPIMGALWMLGVASGLRVGDLLAIERHQLGRKMQVVESKTKKIKKIRLTKKQFEYLRIYAELPSKSSKLFPVDRTTVYRWFKRVASDLEISALIGTHTMRKTYLWNVFLYSKGDIETTRRAANHRYHSTTIDYLRGGIAMLVARYARRNKKGIRPSMPEGEDDEIDMHKI